MASDSLYNSQQLIARVKCLIINQLKDVLKREKLPVSGVKAALQERIIAQINHYANKGDYESYNRLREIIRDPKGNFTPSPAQPRAPPSSVSLPPIEPTYTLPNGHSRPPPNYPTTMPQRPYSTAVRLQFKESPFYTIMEALTPVTECKESVREATRDTVDLRIVLRKELADRMQADRGLKAMIYCAADPVNPYMYSDIAFPHQVEIKVNEDEVKANLRGLKNRPGSTRPADITRLLRIRADYSNMMKVTYALTQKKFYIVVNLVRQHHVEELVARLQSGRVITKEQVIREMVSKAQDTEIQATSSIMSLKCPISTLRIDVPCRSTICTHNQCYDAPSFLQLQEQAPTWTCPVCGKLAVFEALTVDRYVDDILKSTPRSVEQVTIEPDGQWRQTSDDDQPSNRRGGHASSDDDDEELVEINMPRLDAVKNETPNPMIRTPPDSTRSGSSSARPSLAGQKRQAEVIDLSSDDDDVPPRAPKRQSTVSSQPQLNSVASFPTESSRRPSYPSNASFQLPRPSPFPGGRGNSNPMAPGYRPP